MTRRNRRDTARLPGSHHTQVQPVGGFASSGVPDVDCVQVATVGRPHGVRGELTIWPHNPSSTLLRELFGPKSKRQTILYIAAPDETSGQVLNWSVLGIRAGRKGTLMLRVDGINDRDSAAEYRGWRLLIPKSALPVLQSEDEFYFHQLEGESVVLDSGFQIGQVRRVFETSCEVLEIERLDGSELLVPILTDTVKSFGPPVVLYEHVLDWFDMTLDGSAQKQHGDTSKAQS